MTIEKLRFLRAQAWANMLAAGEVAKISPSPLTKANHETAWHLFAQLDDACKKECAA